MKITSLETILLSDDWREVDRYWRGGPVNSTALVRVHTDEGVTGLGETLLGYFAPETVPEIVRFYEPLLQGRDPLDISALWNDMYKSSFFWGRNGAGISVISAIDMALWDLKAKALGLPLWRLIGGLHRDRVQAYASGGSTLWPMEEAVAKMTHYRDLGYTAAKFAVSSVRRRAYDPLWGMRSELPTGGQLAREEREKLEAFRSALGDEFTLLAQSSGFVPYTRTDAYRISDVLAEFGVMFYEEPLVCENLDDMVRVRGRSLIPIAGGEALTGLQEFRRFIDAGALDVVQPDLSHCGGITVALQVAALARAHHKKLAFHLGGSFGPTYAAALHLSVSLPECVILEQVPATDAVRRRICDFSIDLDEQGRVSAPQGVGLGVTLSEESQHAMPFIPGSGERT